MEEIFHQGMESDWLLSAYDYVLPAERIAQTPVFPRDSSRLLVVQDQQTESHGIFRDLPNLLQAGDLLVLNNTRVIPARLYGCKPSGLPVEVLLLEPKPGEGSAMGRWLALVKPGRRLKPGARIFFGPQTEAALARTTGKPEREASDEPETATPLGPTDFLLTATVMETDPPTGGRILQFETTSDHPIEECLETLGQIPLPPYITESQAEPEQYQTVYAHTPGAVAAPTAGLHFTPELLQTLADRGIEQAFVTLHVGVGTFRPVEAEEILQHQMHAEWVEVSEQTVEKIRQTKARGGRVIAVGTTVVRSLEGAAALSGSLQPFCGKTNLFIYPGYQWRVVEGLITNFHLPKSSLMMLVSALIGRQRLLDLYQLAISEAYRFYSFGDAMLILPEARVEQAQSPASLSTSS